jgi:peptidoglycan-N-acetylmuramic acid deacetylase
MKAERRERMKRLFILILICVSLANISVISVNARETSYSWYCNRTPNHIQPNLPAEFEFIKRYDAIWLNTMRNDLDDKRIAYLTFDAGYENGNIAKILDVLKNKKVPGAFFILENLINSNPEIVLRMQNEGHLVCNHTAHHKDMSQVIDFQAFSDELSKLSESYKQLTGSEMSRYYRPPEGKFNEKNLEICQQLGYKTVFWSFAYADWDNQNQPSKEFAKKKILDNMHNGAVLLLHPTSSTNAEILETIIDEMRSHGYEFGTLDDLASELSQS